MSALHVQIIISLVESAKLRVFGKRFTILILIIFIFQSVAIKFQFWLKSILRDSPSAISQSAVPLTM
jgi:hypothetical protein